MSYYITGVILPSYYQLIITTILILSVKMNSVSRETCILNSECFLLYNKIPI